MGIMIPKSTLSITIYQLNKASGTQTDMCGTLKGSVSCESDNSSIHGTQKWINYGSLSRSTNRIRAINN